MPLFDYLKSVSNPSLLPIAVCEAEILALVQLQQPIFLPTTNLKLEQLRSGLACALHMH